MLVYDGPQRPLSEVAVIGEASRTAALAGINGKPAVSYIKENRRQKGYHVLPGKYLVKVITQPTATLFPLVGGTYAGAIHVEAARDIELVAVAGHTYIPRAGKDVSGKIVVYLEDMGPAPGSGTTVRISARPWKPLRERSRGRRSPFVSILSRR